MVITEGNQGGHLFIHEFPLGKKKKKEDKHTPLSYNVTILEYYSNHTHTKQFHPWNEWR